MPLPSAAIFVIAIAIAVSAAICTVVARRALQQGGNVSAREFGRGDLLLGGFFAAWFGLLTVRGLMNGPQPVQEGDLYNGAALFAVIVVGITGFLQFRGINVWRQFGFARVFPPRAAAIALGLLLAAAPIILLVSKLTEVALGGERQPQEVVRFFAEAAARSDHRALALMLFFGVVVAPFAEEFLFRGYLYGVIKRFCGPLPAMLLSTSLFAGIHLNLPAMPGLFVLALAFTLAYEATGSLLVSIFMHALFNLSTFLFLLHAPESLG